MEINSQKLLPNFGSVQSEAKFQLKQIAWWSKTLSPFLCRTTSTERVRQAVSVSLCVCLCKSRNFAIITLCFTYLRSVPLNTVNLVLPYTSVCLVWFWNTFPTKGGLEPRPWCRRNANFRNRAWKQTLSFKPTTQQLWMRLGGVQCFANFLTDCRITGHSFQRNFPICL